MISSSSSSSLSYSIRVILNACIYIGPDSIGMYPLRMCPRWYVCVPAELA